MKNKQKKKATRSYHLLTKNCLSRDSADRPKDIADSFSHAVTWQWRQWPLSRDGIFQIQLLLADGNLEIFSFSAYFSSSFPF